MRKMRINEEVTWKEITPGGIIEDSGNADDFKTGDWRSMRPIWHEDKCKHCMFCFFVCPDSSIIVEDGKMKGIDYNHCKGCGVCTEACPFKAFDFVEEKK